MKHIRTWPSRVWLQQGDDPAPAPYTDCAEVTWHEEQIFDTDIEYVRIDLYNSILARLRRAPEGKSE